MDKLPLLGPGHLEILGNRVIGISSLRVPFHDADPAGVVWHGNYFKYFDAARCVVLDAMEYGYAEMAESGYVWPVVDARIKYVSAIYYDETITVRADLAEAEYRLKFEYEILGANGARRASGYTIQVAVEAGSGEMRFGVPEFVKDRVKCLIKTS